MFKIKFEKGKATDKRLKTMISFVSFRRHQYKTDIKNEFTLNSIIGKTYLGCPGLLILQSYIAKEIS